jgi:acylphosphatase
MPPALGRAWVLLVTDSQAAPERREIYFSGRVQGVGFRYTARDIAGRFPVTGFVKNLADGRVLLVAEGPGTILERFIDAIAAEMDRVIDHKQISVLPATGEFSAFEVRR